ILPYENTSGCPRGADVRQIQTEKYGTPLAQSLRVLARELRDERLMAAEAKAARLPVTLMVPMVIFILPVLFIVLIGPGAINILDGLKSL
ncbi:MAG: type II secretion system F family protein, partial [Rhodospirillaceae bacterium]|nr:type II secretion system F family protein [Rhodospirillaceae bacterium]MDD9928343.1 type II secretion system F family protein [Rhodospirillaceae bacterium]